MIIEGDDFVANLRRASLAASAVGNPELEDVLRDLTAEPQAMFDLHLSGATVDEHSTRADWFGQFVSRMAVAVKEVSKSLAGKDRMAVGLRVVGPTAGSVRVQLMAPAPITTQDELPDSHSMSLESMALRHVAGLMQMAEGDSVASDDSPLTAAVQVLDGRARGAVQSAVKTVIEAGWEIEGEVRQRGHEPEHVVFSPGAAERLSIELQQSVERRESVTLRGYIDGQRHSLGAMWFIRESGGRPVEAAVGDVSLLDEVTSLSVDARQLVEANFEMLVTQPRGDSRSERRSFELRRIRRVPDTPDLFD